MSDGLHLLGTTTLVSTSEIKWSDGKFVQLGDRYYDKNFGAGKVSELQASRDAPGGAKWPPRVTVAWDKGGSFSWETSTLDAACRQAPPVAGASPVDGTPLYKKPVAVAAGVTGLVALAGAVWAVARRGR